MITRICNFIRIHLRLKRISKELQEIKDQRFKLTYKPRLKDIPDNLEKLENLAFKKKALKKLRDKLRRKLPLQFSS